MERLYAFPTEELEQDGPYLTINLCIDQDDQSQEALRIQLENASKQAKKLIEEDLSEPSLAEPILAQLKGLATDYKALPQQARDLVFYIHASGIYYYHLFERVPAFEFVADYPALSPVLINNQLHNHFHLLKLSRGKIKLYEVYGDQLQPVTLEGKDIPETMAEAVGTDYDPANITPPSTPASHAFHGHSDTSDERDKDREFYFKLVDDYIYQQYSKKYKLPLVLLALEENEVVFRKLSKNQYLEDQAIHSGNNFTDQQVEKIVKESLRAQKEQELTNLKQRFQETSPEFKVKDSLDSLAQLAIAGRIEELILAKEYMPQGDFDPTGQYNEAGKGYRQQLIHQVLKTQGKVYLLDQDLLGDDFKIAARLRY
ncbi:hypothetical protein [Ignavigranum ruoffiae]|uniref:baeRF6 domain-containing protein n=1 Tax=Ignavigranum ruoffiae TaxID=89093 RepID=UPI0024AD2CB2|nr:hypothetical protein [Ignavigranum ruoffiae]